MKTTSKAADRHALYQVATQAPAAMVGLIDQRFRKLFRDEPLNLCEDFCGSAQLACVWALSDSERQAVGVDKDRATLEWTKRHNLPYIGSAAKRVRLVRSDVMNHKPRTRYDAIASLNFSHFIYHNRADLLFYFRHAYSRLAQHGLMLIDAFGGPGAMTPHTDRRAFDGQDFQGNRLHGAYQWQQVSFDPLTHRILCHIHFKQQGRAMLRQAFTYDWRLWSLPELRELLREAGFDRVEIYFESSHGFVQDASGTSGASGGGRGRGGVGGLPCGREGFAACT